jgi:hypothetical protein
MEIIIGLDIGYGHTKWTTDGETVKTIPSVVTTTNLRDFDSDLFASTSGYRDLAIEMAGSRYLVGEFAMREDAQASRVITTDRTAGAEFKALLGTVILSEMDNDEDSTIFTGLPYNTPKEMLSRLKNMLLDMEEPMRGVSGLIKNHFWCGKLADVKVFKQAQAMIFDAVFEQVDGKIVPVRDQELITIEGTRAAVVDIGYKTTDVIVCEVIPEFRVIQELSFTIPHAVSSVGRRMQEEFQRIIKNGETTLDPRRLDQAILKGKIANAGKIIDLAPARDHAVNDISQQIMNQIFEKWGKALMTVQVVYLGGGGAELFGAPLTKNLHENVHKIDEPQGANARGYYKMQHFLNPSPKAEEKKTFGPPLRTKK